MWLAVADWLTSAAPGFTTASTASPSLSGTRRVPARMSTGASSTTDPHRIKMVMGSGIACLPTPSGSTQCGNLEFQVATPANRRKQCLRGRRPLRTTGV